MLKAHEIYVRNDNISVAGPKATRGGNVKSGPAEEEPLSNPKVKTGDKAPDFTLPSVNGEAISLADALRAQHNILLAFGRHLG
jgi:hypothetical protein